MFRPQMFASRLNKKLQQYVSCATQRFYLFPPFSLLTKVLQKIQEDVAEGIVVTLFWPTQP